MKTPLTLSVAAALALAASFSPALAAARAASLNLPALEIAAPRCEDVREPVGLRRTAPRFSWALAGAEPATRPAAAEVRVGREGRPLWTRRTPDLFACVYDGPALAPGVPYAWQARLVNADGSPATDWCAPQRFVLGLRSATDWEGAQWVGEAPRDVQWTDFDYQVKFRLVKDAFGLYFRAQSADRGYMWQLNTVVGPEPLLRPHVFLGKDGFRGLPPVGLNRFFPQGLDWTKDHVLAVKTRGPRIETWLDGVKVDAREDATFASGTVGVRTSHGEEALVSEVSVKAPDGTSLLFDRFQGHVLPAFHKPSLKGDALHLTGNGFLHPGILPKNAPRVRRTFALKDKPVRHAYASVCGLGFYELWLNGRKADPSRVLAPGWTDPGRAALFDTYDVTALLKPGAANTVGCWLAAGYSDDFSRYAWHWLKTKRAIVHLAVTYADGTRDVVVSDGSWEVSQGSEVTRASIYNGETVDASRADPAWCTPAGARTGWTPVRVYPAEEAGPLRANDAPPVRLSDPRRPVKIVETRPGVFVADFGQNRAGVVAVRAKGPKGARIRVHTSELLGKDGNIDPWTNGIAESTDEFVLAGTGAVEEFRPRFTYHGFRYAEITGWPASSPGCAPAPGAQESVPPRGSSSPGCAPAPGARANGPTLDDLTSWAVSADVEPAGDFACSDPTLEKFVNAAKWSMRSNFVSYPTDCCMRGERTPCQMDSQAYEDAALQAFGLTRFYEKWLDDIRGGRGNPDWTGDAATLPWRLWWNTGDVRVLADRYADMAGQVDADAQKWPDLVCPSGFGDWCAPNDGTWRGFFNDVEIVNSAIFCQMCGFVAEAAKVLGKAEDTARYGDLHARAKAAFHAKFFHAETATYGDGSQTTSVLPLAFGLVPAAHRDAVAAQLLRTIRGRNGSKVDVGIFGMRYLGDVLGDLGEADLFVHLMTQPEFPGFGFMFANDATTLWEQWTYRSGMNTHNHAMFSGALHSLMTRLAGIRAAAAGYAAVEVRPLFPQALAWAKAHRDTPRGRVAVDWRREGGRVRLDVTVPPFTPATLVLPDGSSRPLRAGRQTVEL